MPDPMNGIYMRQLMISCQACGTSPAGTNREVIPMTKSIIPIAGIFLACVIAAGIPSVAAADPVKTAAAPTIEPTPWYTNLGEWLGLHAQSTTPPVNATPVKTTEDKNWLDNLWPFKDTTQKTDTPETTPQTAVQAPVQTPAQTPVQIPAQAPTVNQDHTTQKSVSEKPPETKTIEMVHTG